MLCPICNAELHKEKLDKGLEAFCCEEHGKWIPAINYWKWIAIQHISYPPQIEPGEFDDVSEMDRHGEKICSDCGRFLSRYSIGHGIAFHIDQCSSCAGIWLDSGEWEILKKKNLHNAIHFMFSESWQSKVAREKHDQSMEDILIDKMGRELYNELKDLRSRLLDQNLKDLAVSFLSNS